MKYAVVFASKNWSVRRYCKRELEAEGYRVIPADDADDALNVVETFAIDLMIVDHLIPNCGGLNLAAQIKQMCPHLPLVLFTTEDRKFAQVPLVVDAVVVQSAELSALKRTVRGLLQTRRGSPERRRESLEEWDAVFSNLEMEAIYAERQSIEPAIRRY